VGARLGADWIIIFQPHVPHPARVVVTVTNASAGGSDVAASAAAALAAASLALRSTDPAFSATILEGASQLYTLARQLRARTNATHCAVAACSGAVAAGPAGGPWPWTSYPSSLVDDDLAWAAAWLGLATGVGACERAGSIR
jgi:endoglucanase